VNATDYIVSRLRERPATPSQLATITLMSLRSVRSTLCTLREQGRVVRLDRRVPNVNWKGRRSTEHLWGAA
jgi:predicted Rossmann fold nucleotide-binding protein DprA/Smf involved in DNA uptake